LGGKKRKQQQQRGEKRGKLNYYQDNIKKAKINTGNTQKNLFLRGKTKNLSYLKGK